MKILVHNLEARSRGIRPRLFLLPFQKMLMVRMKEDSIKTKQMGISSKISFGRAKS